MSSVSEGIFLGGNGVVPGTGHPNSWAPREGTPGSAGSTCGACRRCGRWRGFLPALCIFHREARGWSLRAARVRLSESHCRPVHRTRARPGPARPAPGRALRCKARGAGRGAWAGRGVRSSSGLQALAAPPPPPRCFLPLPRGRLFFFFPFFFFSAVRDRGSRRLHAHLKGPGL